METILCNSCSGLGDYLIYPLDDRGSTETRVCEKCRGHGFYIDGRPLRALTDPELAIEEAVKAFEKSLNQKRL